MKNLDKSMRGRGFTSLAGRENIVLLDGIGATSMAQITIIKLRKTEFGNLLDLAKKAGQKMSFRNPV